MDEQRKRIYSFRQSLLDGAPPKDAIMSMIENQVRDAAKRFLVPEYGPASFAEWAGERLGIEFRPRDFKNMSFEEAEEYARTEAENQVPDLVWEAIEEHLPSDAESSEWNWLAMANWINTRYGLSIKDKDLRKFARVEHNPETSTSKLELDRSELKDFLEEQAVAAIKAVELAPAKEFLDEDWGLFSLSGWVHHKFGLALDPANWRGLTSEEVAKKVVEEGKKHYVSKEAEFPVRVALSRFFRERDGGPGPRYDREGLAAWASERYQAQVDVEVIRPLLRPEIESLLIDVAYKRYEGGKVNEELESKFLAAFGPPPEPTAKNQSSRKPDHADLEDLARWANGNLDLETSVDELEKLDRTEARNKLFAAFDAKFRPEMIEMERALVLQLLDSSWMEHLRAMDHLRSSVGLRGYAQVDPKVEYKREGMKIFEEMWNGVSDKVTDLVFRMEQVDPDFLNSLSQSWKLDRASNIHEAPSSDYDAPSGGIRAQQDAAIAASQTSTEKKQEPVRNLGKKVGRNDPCPCGSGKKYKTCCMRKEARADV